MLQRHFSNLNSSVNTQTSQTTLTTPNNNNNNNHHTPPSPLESLLCRSGAARLATSRVVNRFFWPQSINIITTITQKQRADVAPRALMQMSQIVLHSPITFRLLSLYCATLPILTCICTLACSVPHTHNRSHLLSHSHSHSHFTWTSPMLHHQSHSLVLASTLLHNCSCCLRGYVTNWLTHSHSFSMYRTCHVTDHICMCSWIHSPSVNHYQQFIFAPSIHICIRQHTIRHVIDCTATTSLRTHIHSRIHCSTIAFAVCSWRLMQFTDMAWAFSFSFVDVDGDFHFLFTFISIYCFTLSYHRWSYFRVAEC